MDLPSPSAWTVCRVGFFLHRNEYWRFVCFWKQGKFLMELMLACCWVSETLTRYAEYALHSFSFCSSLRWQLLSKGTNSRPSNMTWTVIFLSPQNSTSKVIWKVQCSSLYFIHISAIDFGIPRSANVVLMDRICCMLSLIKQFEFAHRSLYVISMFHSR